MLFRSLLWGVFGATYLLFATNEIGLGPAAIGLITGIGGLGAFVGAALAGRMVARLGAGRTMVLGLAGTAFGSALIPLAPSGAVVIGALFLIAQQVIGDAFGVAYEVVEESVTQAMVDDRVLGRVNATVSFITTVTALAGAIVGGIVGELVGLRAAFLVGLVGSVAAVLVVWWSPVRHLRTVEDAARLRTA